MLSLSLHTSYIRRIKKSFKKVKAQHQRKERGKSVFLDVRNVFLVCVVVFLPFAAGVLFSPLSCLTFSMTPVDTRIMYPSFRFFFTFNE